MERWNGGRLVVAAAVVALGIALYGPSALATGLIGGIPVPKGKDVTFGAEVDLQAIYDEISQLDVPSADDADLGSFPGAVYTPDFVFVDSAGQKSSLEQMLAREGQAAPLDSMIQRIQHFAVMPGGGVTALVTLTTVRTIEDAAGRYGRAGASHTLTEVTEYRDGWVRVADGWKLKSREQVSRTKTYVDLPDTSY